MEGHCCLPVRPVPPPPSWNPRPFLDYTPDKCLQHLAVPSPALPASFSSKGELKQPLPWVQSPLQRVVDGKSVTLK